MRQHAEGAFVIDQRDETPIDWAGARMRRAHWTKKFTGDLSGTSAVEFIMGELDGAGGGEAARVYVGVERFDCTLRGRSGTFVLVHTATMLGSEHQAQWTILPGSGTGELAGISGQAEILPNHDFILDYDLHS